jgi:hypothetical protein
VCANFLSIVPPLHGWLSLLKQYRRAHATLERLWTEGVFWSVCGLQFNYEPANSYLFLILSQLRLPYGRVDLLVTRTDPRFLCARKSIAQAATVQTGQRCKMVKERNPKPF